MTDLLTARGAALLAILVAIGALLVACPGYEDTYSGHYRQVDIDEFDDEAVALEFFQSGHHVQAVIRFYDLSSASARANPFDPANEERCLWTRVSEFDPDDRSFELTIPASVRHDALTLQGQFQNSEDLQLSLAGDDDEPRQLDLRANPSSDPNSDCRAVDDFLVRPIFNQGQQTLDPEDHELRHPVFSLLWVGVVPERQDGALVFVELNRPGPSIRLDQSGHFDGGANGLTGTLSVNIPPPPDQILIDSGDTRYGLGHFLVIDDSDGDGSFSWNISDEPVIATSLEEGRPDSAPEHLEINGWGKALFFVEDSLHDLSSAMRFRLDGLDDAEPNRNFYIVDVFFYNEEVVSLRLPPRPQAEQPLQRRIPMEVTSRFLTTDSVPVPRLFPYN